MKKLILILGTLVLTGSLFGQSKFSGFFKPDNIIVKERMIISKDGTSILKFPWIMRPAVFGTFTGVQFGGGKPEARAFEIFGAGVSLAKYSTVDGKAYCDYSFNATAITNVNGEFKIGVAGTIDVFDKKIGVGIGYLDNHPMLLTTFSYSF